MSGVLLHLYLHHFVYVHYCFIYILSCKRKQYMCYEVLLYFMQISLIIQYFYWTDGMRFPYFYMLHPYLATCYNFDVNPTHTQQHVIMCEINTRCDRRLPNRKKFNTRSGRRFPIRHTTTAIAVPDDNGQFLIALKTWHLPT